MTTCAEARASMYEAPPMELQPGPGSPLTRHLEGCAACRRVARRLIAGDAALDRMLASLSREAPAAGERSAHGHRKAAAWGAGLAATAAAAVAAVVALLLAPDPVRMNPAWQPAASHLAPAADVQVADGAATVFAASDHAVTFVWLYPSVSGTDSEQNEEIHR